FAVGNRNFQQFARWNFIREWRIGCGGFQENMFAVELQIAVANERAGQQTRFGEHLKTVADAEDKAAVVGELFHGLHHGAEPRDGAAPQIIAVAETAGHDDRVGGAKGIFLVPDITGRMAEQPDGMDGVLVTVAGGKLDNGKVHFLVSSQQSVVSSDVRVSVATDYELLTADFVKLIQSPICNLQ